MFIDSILTEVTHVRQDEGVSRTPLPDPAALWRRLAAEFLGSAFLAAIVIGSGIAAQRLSPSDTGLELLENSAATAAGLFAIILMFGPVSGAHFNPVVSFADAALGGMSWRDAAAYLPAQVAGCVTGAVAANLMFAQAAVSISVKHRASGAHALSEVIATAGLMLVIFALARSGRLASRPGGGRRLHRRGVLVHLLHQLRQPRDHHRPDVLRHLRRDRAVLGPGVHRRPDRRRHRRGGHHQAPVPRAHPRPGRRGRRPARERGRRSRRARPGRR